MNDRHYDLYAANMYLLRDSIFLNKKGNKMKFIPSPNFSKRNDTIQEIILHYTDSRSFEGNVAWLCDGNRPNRTSAHYVVGREGEVAQLVKESDKAWHASSHNSKSIGIENSANKDDKLTEAQEAALVELLKDILKRNNLPWSCITAHRFTNGNEDSTNCPANLWPTKQSLEDWKQKHFATPIKKPSSTISVGKIGPEVVELHKLLVDKKYLGAGNHGDAFTTNTEAAVKWFQRTNGLYSDGIVGPKTWAALQGVPPPKTKVITLKRTRKLDDNGCEELLLQCGSLAFIAVSGQPGKQNFRLPTDPKSFAGNNEPLPQGNYEFGVLEWQNGFENFNNFNDSGLAPLFITLIASFDDDRGAFGMHHEGTIPGTAGCVAFKTLADLKKFYFWFKENKPLNLVVMWGL
jgi:N-acetyl-anhydromuramyl-L-alanine amidase AmpD